MGLTLFGLTCSDVMEMRYNEMEEIATTINSVVDMTLDMVSNR